MGGVSVAYVSDSLPSMDELKDAATRPLTPFEDQGLARLKSEEDLIVQDGLNEILMLGSVRATSGCTACHNVTRGELLGAFSYQMHRKTPVAPDPSGEGEGIAWRAALR